MGRLSDGHLHAAALAGLAGMTPVRLAKLLDGFLLGKGSPVGMMRAEREGNVAQCPLAVLFPRCC